MRCFSKILTVSWCLFFASLLGAPTATAADGGRNASSSKVSSAQAAERYGDLPLSFEANQGQTDTQVRFVSRGSGYSFFLTQTGATLTFLGDSRSEAVLQMQLAGANRKARIHGLDELPGKINYFLGSNSQHWRTGVPTFSKVAYENIYPGISLIYYGNQRQLEYDFVVAPGADPRQIRLNVAGAQTLSVDPQGNLVLRSAAGEVQLLAPKVYQQIDGQKQEIAGQWTLQANNVAGFRLGTYDRKHALVIDPVLQYSSFLGGTQKNVLNRIAIDAAGNAYVAGYTTSGNFPAAPTPQAMTFGAGAPSRGAFIAKIDPSGSNLLFSTYLSGSADEEATGLAVDKLGNVFVVGNTHSADFPTRNAFQSTCATHTQAGTCSSAFLTKISPTGDAILFSTYLGGSGGESARSLAIDAAGSAYVAGVTSSMDFPVTAGAAQTKCGGTCQQNAFVAKFNATGDSLAYASYVGGSGIDDAADLAVDSSGSAYITGRTTSPDFPLATAFQKSCAPDATSTSAACVATAFVTKIKVDGSAFAYSTYLGGRLGSQAAAISVDSLGNAYVTGSTQSPDFPVVKAFQKACGADLTSGKCSVDAFLTKIAPSGKTLIYSTYLGGSGRDEASGIVVDAAGNAHIVGRTESADFPTIASVQSQLKGTSDAFAVRFNPSGSSLGFSTYHGGSATESGNGIALDAKGNIYLAGETSSADFPISHPFQSSCAGACTSAFVTKMALPPAVTPLTITKAFGAASIPLNGTTSLTFTIDNTDAVTTQTGIAFTDNLPAGLVVATPNGLSNTCGGTATAVAGSGSISLSGATLAPTTSCTASVNVTGTTAGVKNNSVQISSTEGGTGNTSNASITVVAPPVIIKAFGAASIPLNGSTSLTFTIQNNNTTTTLNGIAFSDTLPAGLVISTPNGLTGSCGGGTITATQATSVISLATATLAQSTSCTFSVNVTGTAAGQQNNTTGNVTSTEGGTGGTASASINVVAPPAIAKAFNPTSIPLNATTTLTFTITNPAANAVAETGVAFTDTLPAGLVVSTPNGLADTCGGTATAVAGSTSISLTGGGIPLNTSCTLALNITGTAAGQYTNTTGAVSSTNGGTGNTATANLTVATPPTITKAFGAANIPLNGTTTLTFDITNPNTTVALTGLAFTDNLPAGLVVATPNGLTNNCGGTSAAVAGSGQISLTGASLAGSGTCTIKANVTGTTAGVKNNSVQVTSTDGGTGNTSNASITVVAPPVIIKAFGAASVPLNGSTSLTFTIQNNNTTTTLNGIGFSDTLPSGLVISTPNGLTGSCGGGTITATQATGVISLATATLAQSSSCTFSVNVTGTTGGTKNNTTGNVTSTEGGTGGTASASLNVVAPPSIAKAFGAASIPLNTTTTLTITITNPAANAVAETGVAFTDTLPAGLVVATPNGLTNTCGGTATAVAGSGSISLTGGTIAASTSCAVVVNIPGTAAGQYTNTTGAVSSTNGGTGNTATDTLIVVAPPSLTKAFSPTTITLNATTALTFTITNPTGNPVALTGVAFTDTLQGGLTATATPTNTCGGTLTASGTAISLTGATVPVGSPGTCSLSVTVQGATGGLNISNTTSAVTSTNGGAGTASNTATVTVQDYGFSAIDTTSTFIQGSTVPAAASVTITPQFTYAGTVSSAGCAPPGFNCTFTATTGGNNLPVSITAAANTPVGPYAAITLSASGTALNGGPVIVHSAAPFALAVECTMSQGSTTLAGTTPTYTPSVTTAPFTFFVTEVAGGSNCPWGPSANAIGVPGVMNTTGLTLVTGGQGQVSALGTGSPITYDVTPIAVGAAAPQVDSIIVSYFQMPGGVGSFTHNVVQEIPLQQTANAGQTSTFSLVVSANPNNQAGSTLTFPLVQGLNAAAAPTMCSAVAIDTTGAIVPDPNNLNYGVSCTLAATPLTGSQVSLSMQVTIPPGLKAANSPTQERGRPVLFYAFLLGLPAVFLTGTGTFAFGSRRQRLTLRRLTSVAGISLVLALLVLLPACGGGFKANFGGNKTASFSLTAVGYVTDGANDVQGVEILPVPLNIVK